MKNHSALLLYLHSAILRCVLVAFALQMLLPRTSEATPGACPHLLICPYAKDEPGKAAQQRDTDGVSFFFTDKTAVFRKISSIPCAARNGMPNESDDTPDEGVRKSSLTAGLLSVSIRGTLSSTDIIGSDATEKFRAYDAALTFRLPWGWQSLSGWGVDVRLMTSVGTITGSGDTGLVVSFVPLLDFGSRDGRFVIDMGAGAALFSRTAFGTQDFGGYLQFALTAGAAVPLFKGVGAGYRFMHYSDAALHGSDTTGADLHMLNITYRF